MSRSEKDQLIPEQQLPIGIKYKGPQLKLDAIETLKVRKKQIIKRVQNCQKSNTYLEYLLSIRDYGLENNGKLTTQTDDLILKRPKDRDYLQTKKIKKSFRKSSDQNQQKFSSISQILLDTQINSFRRKRPRNLKINRSQVLSDGKDIKTTKKPLSLQRLPPIKQSFRKKQNKSHKILDLSSISSRQKNNNNLQILVKNLSKLPSKRTTEQIKTIKNYLVKNNQLFKKIPSQIALCILKIGEYHRYAAGSCIYKLREHRDCVFLLLQGVVHLSNSNFQIKKLVFAGQLFGQEMILASTSSLESTKSVTDSISLSLSKDQFQLLSTESIRLELKDQFSIFDNLLKNSYHAKKLSRNQSIQRRRQS